MKPIREKIRQWMEDRLDVLPFKDPERKIFAYGSWIPAEEIEILKRIVDTYRDEYPNMVIIAENFGEWPLIYWDTSNPGDWTSILRTDEWDEKEKKRMKKAIFDIFMLKNLHKGFGFQERDNFIRKKIEDTNNLLTDITTSPDFIGEMKKFVFETIEEYKKPVYNYSTNPETFGSISLVKGLDREREVLTKRLELFKSLYYKNNGIKRHKKT